jgi:uncharacterized protein involved in exopolysaccharide biosynthesis
MSPDHVNSGARLVRRRPFHGAEPLISMRDVLGVLFLRKWTVFLMFALVVGVAAGLVFYLLSPRYEASATLTIQAANLVNPLAEGVNQSDMEKALTFHTQRDVIQSYLIASRVVDRLGLAQQRKLSRIEIIAGELREQRRQLGEKYQIASWTRPFDSRAAAIEALSERLELTTRPDSMAIKLSCQAYDANEAADICNAVVDEYSLYYYGQIQHRANGILGNVDQRLKTAQQKLTDSEQALLAFRQRDTMVIESSAPSAEARPAAPVRPGKGAVKAPRLPSPPVVDGIVGVTDSSQVQNEMKSYVLAMEDELRKLLSEYPETHPAVRELRRRVMIYTETMNQIPGREIELGRLRRELEVNQSAFVELRKSFERIKVIAAGAADGARLINIVDVAAPNERAIAPKPRIAMSLALVFGLLFGLVAAFALEYMDHRIRSVRDVENHLGVRLIASIEELRR